MILILLGKSVISFSNNNNNTTEDIYINETNVYHLAAKKNQEFLLHIQHQNATIIISPSNKFSITITDGVEIQVPLTTFESGQFGCFIPKNGSILLVSSASQHLFIQAIFTEYSSCNNYYVSTKAKAKYSFIATNDYFLDEEQNVCILYAAASKSNYVIQYSFSTTVFSLFFFSRPFHLSGTNKIKNSTLGPIFLELSSTGNNIKDSIQFEFSASGDSYPISASTHFKYPKAPILLTDISLTKNVTDSIEVYLFGMGLGFGFLILGYLLKQYCNHQFGKPFFDNEVGIPGGFPPTDQIEQADPSFVEEKSPNFNEEPINSHMPEPTISIDSASIDLDKAEQL